MNKIALYIFTVSLIALSYTSMGQESGGLGELQAQYKSLQKSQDSLQILLNTSRGEIGSAQGDALAALSAAIVCYEGELFDVKAKLSHTSRNLAAIEERAAVKSLNQVEEHWELNQSSSLYDNVFFNDYLSKKGIETLKNSGKVEAQTIEAIKLIEPLYAALKQLKINYDRSINQNEVDRIIVEAGAIKSKIEQIDLSYGHKWRYNYNYLFDTYLVMLDRAPKTDRSTLEIIESEGREVRRAETFAQQGSLTPNLVVFDIQRKFLLTYERAIAKAAELNRAYSVLSAKKITDIEVDFQDIEFLPKILTIYAPVELGRPYFSDNAADIPEIILPQSGVYYTIQIALMSAPPKSMAMFKKASPIQVERTKEGKFRYSVGGYHTYEAAIKDVTVLQRANYRAPRLVCYVDGAITTIAKARAAQAAAATAKDGIFKVIVTTEDPSVSNKLRESVAMHAKDKNISRIARENKLIFTVSGFTSSEEAQVFAQIIREKTGAEVAVEQIKGT